MSRTLIYRQNRFFKINTDQLSTKANTPAVMNALYADLYIEFTDAQYNPKYMNMDLVTRMNAVNDYARNWLTDKGF